jgi:NAD-dependent SIR2 family protein deacetylase
MNLIPVENHKDLWRDPSTNAILNNNKTEHDNYLSNYNRLKREQQELEKLKSDVSSLTQNVDEIKSLLKLLVKEKNDVN